MRSEDIKKAKEILNRPTATGLYLKKMAKYYEEHMDELALLNGYVSISWLVERLEKMELQDDWDIMQLDQLVKELKDV